jgi:hypothetical protein
MRSREIKRIEFEGCQLPCVANFGEGIIQADDQPFLNKLKRSLAVPWNYHIKRWLKIIYHKFNRKTGKRMATPLLVSSSLKAGDMVRVRSWEEIQPTLDPFKETKGCAFLPEMRQYCSSSQRVLQVMERFLDERDYKVKKVRGVLLLEGVICSGTPVYGRCDRCCHLFWREEWVEKIE